MLYLFFSSTFVYIKFLLVWILIMIADFVLEFRFEFLWPLWLFMRSLYDSFKYQGIVIVSFCITHYIINYKIIYVYIFFLFKDIFNFFRTYCFFIRPRVLYILTGSVAVLCSRHLCLGAIRVAQW